MVGKKAVILGSGDVGLIMARRLTLEGAKVECVAEILPHPGGLARNVVQCLDDYEIPLLLNHTVTEIRGFDRVESVTLSQVDENLNPVKGTEREILCDTLLLSVGLIPENELSKKARVLLDETTGGPTINERYETSVPGIFAAGNVLHVHDIADCASIEAKDAGRCAARYAKNLFKRESGITVKKGEDIRYVVPQKASPKRDLTLSFRVCNPASDVTVHIKSGEKTIKKEFMRRVYPAEMVQLKLSKGELSGVEELLVEVKA